jgi:hypothetical protein
MASIWTKQEIDQHITKLKECMLSSNSTNAYKYSIGDKTFEYKSFDELIKRVNYFENELLKLDSKKPTFQKIRTRFC